MAFDQNEVISVEGIAAIEWWGPVLEELCVEVGAPITARVPWLTCWARQHVDWQSFVVMVWQADMLMAAAMLARRRVRGLLRVIMLGQGQSDHARLPCREPAAAQCLADGIVAALHRSRRPWIVQLARLPDGDPVLAALTSRLRGCRVQPGTPNSFVRFAPGADLRPLVGAETSGIIAPAGQRLVRENVHRTVQRLTDVDEVAALLPVLAEVRSARDIQLGRRSDHLDPAVREFWFEVLTLLANRGELEVTSVRLNGRLAAYAVALLDPPAYRLWDTRIQPELSDYAPGYLLLDALLDRLRADTRFSEFDAMRSSEPYQEAIAGEQDEPVELRACSSPVLNIPHRLRARFAALRVRMRSRKRDTGPLLGLSHGRAAAPTREGADVCAS